jgi:hypothetical protein
MKSCPKCNRTFPDEGQKFCTFDGGLLIAPQAFDPNATMRATSSDLEAMAEKSTSRELPDPNATIVESYAATVALPRNTAPTGGVPNTGDLNQTSPGNTPPPPPGNTPPPPAGNTPTPPPVYSASDQTVALPKIPTEPLPPAYTPAPPAPEQSVAAAASAPAGAAAAPAKKKSNLPLIIVGVLVVLFLGGGALGALVYFVVLPKLNNTTANQNANENQNQQVAQNTNVNAQPSPTETPTPEVDNYVPPLGTAAFENSNERLDGKLAERYFDFNFYYPQSWQKDPKAGVAGANSFVKVERRLPPDFTQENFSVGWYTSAGTYDGDLPNYPRRVEEVSNVLSKSIPEYRKVSEGPTQVNKMKAYEFRWVGFSKDTERGDLQLWGRVIFLPTGNEGDTTGATLTMLSTNLAPELASIDDLGVKGEAPVILESFRFGKKK